MIWRGRNLNCRALWEELGVSIPEADDGSWSSLLYCPHPDHDNRRSPAFSVNLSKPTCHCFNPSCEFNSPTSFEHAVEVILGCGEKAARRFIMRFTRVSLGGAESPVDGVRRRKTAESLTELRRDLERFERGEFTYLSQQARDYLDARGIDQQARGVWEVGFDETGGGDERLAGRIVIPARDERGVLRFLIRRSIDGRQPKYLYSPGAVKTSILFGLLHVSRNPRMIVLAEGSLDVIRLQLGGIHAVGILGNGFEERQVRLLLGRNPERVVTMFDRDAAGVQDTLDACKKLSRTSLWICRYPSGYSDPAEMPTSAALRSIERAIPRHEFLRRVRELTPTGRKKEVQVGA